MAAPIASFLYTTSGLSVTFTDSSAGVPTSWEWDFGFTGTGSTSNLPNPDVVNFPAGAIYTITLTVSNADGQNTFTLDLVVSSSPTLSLTIGEMVRCDLPIQLAVDSICFRNSIQKWQLYLQNLIDPPIPDQDVFDETKWPPLANVLIAKLIIYDMIMNSAQVAMVSYYAALKQLNSEVSTSTIEIADYEAETGPFILTGNIVINSMLVNGVAYGPSPTFTAPINMLTWLNALGLGSFHLDDISKNLITLANSNIITNLEITVNSIGHTLVFTQTNVRVVPITQIIEGGSSSPGLMGSIKYIETGPSKTEWYDASSFWTSMFKSSGGAGGPGSGSVFENITKTLCMFASRLSIRLPMCPLFNTATIPTFLIAKNKNKCGCGGRRKLPPSKG